MPKSRNRKNHKKKVAHRRLMTEHRKKAYQKRLQELYGAEIAKVLQEQQEKEGGQQDPNELPSGGIIGNV